MWYMADCGWYALVWALCAFDFEPCVVAVLVLCCCYCQSTIGTKLAHSPRDFLMEEKRDVPGPAAYTIQVHGQPISAPSVCVPVCACVYARVRVCVCMCPSAPLSL